MSYQILAGIAACCFAFSQILNKIMSKHSIDRADSLMIFFMMATFTFGVFLFPFVPHSLPSIATLGVIAVATLFFLVGYYAFFHGIFLTDASSSAPLFQVQAAMVGFLAFLFLGERFPASNYFYMGIMLIGAMMVSYSERVGINFLSKGMLLVLAMQVLHAASNILVGFALKDVTALQLLFWEDMMIGGFALLFWLLKKPKLRYSRQQILPMFVSSFVVGCGVIAIFSAFAQNVTMSSVIGLMSGPIVFLFSVIASRFWPQFLEHHSAKTYVVRGAGVAAILGAVSLMILR